MIYETESNRYLHFYLTQPKLNISHLLIDETYWLVEKTNI